MPAVYTRLPFMGLLPHRHILTRMHCFRHQVHTRLWTESASRSLADRMNHRVHIIGDRLYLLLSPPSVRQL